MIKTKREFLDLYQSDKLGNKIRSWPTLKALEASDYKGRVTIRSRQRSWKTLYNISIGEAHYQVVYNGGNDYYFNESAPDDRLILQGEYWNDHTRYLMYSRASLPMKDALALPLGQHDLTPYFTEAYKRGWVEKDWLKCCPNGGQERFQAEGLRAEMLLKASMNTNSWEDFQILRDEYPGHIIEFSCYDCELGSIPGRNTLVWEVRKY